MPCLSMTRRVASAGPGRDGRHDGRQFLLYLLVHPPLRLCEVIFSRWCWALLGCCRWNRAAIAPVLSIDLSTTTSSDDGCI
jgi:hypothetical protein